MSNIDNFLANLSKDVSIDDSKPNKKTVVKENSAPKSSKTKSKKSKDDDFKMDGNILFEGQQGEHRSILDDINGLPSVIGSGRNAIFSVNQYTPDNKYDCFAQ